MKSISTLPIRTPRRVLAGVLIVAVLAAIFGSGTPSRLSNSEQDLYSPGTQSYRTAQLLRKVLGPRAFPEIGILLHFPLKTHEGEPVLRAVQKVATLEPAPVYSRNRHFAVIVGYFHRGVRPSSATARLVKRFHRESRVLISGSALVGQEFRQEIKHDLIMAELIALPLLLLLGFVLFGGAVAAVLPVVVGGVTLAFTLTALRLVNDVYPISILSLLLVAGVAVGLSLDYSLLLVSRFREELSRGHKSSEAAQHALVTAGRTVGFSAATVAVAFTSLLVFPIDVLRSIAVGGMLVAALAGFTAWAIMPAALTLLGHKINRLAPKRWRRDPGVASESKGGWYRVAHGVMRHPIATAAVATVVLLALGVPSLGMRLTGLDATALPTTSDTHRFEQQVKAQFSHPVFDEIAVVAHGDHNQVWTVIHKYMEKLPNIKAGGVRKVKGDIWEFEVNPTRGPFSHATERLVNEIRAVPAHLAVTGVTADYVDTAASIRSHLPIALLILIGTTLVLLFCATGSLILPIKALVMNLLVLAAACGLLVLIFQAGRLEGVLGYHGQGALALTQPVMLGAATFGILTDYGVFLLTRIRECWDEGLSNSEAVATGLERTGPIVTAAALLFCVAVGALVTSRIVTVKEGAIGIAVAVALDATLVRALLVPSLMVLLGRWNWWCPRWLRWSAPAGITPDRDGGQAESLTPADELL